jgi:rhodanese-related sulfurtransferase
MRFVERRRRPAFSLLFLCFFVPLVPFVPVVPLWFKVFHPRTRTMSIAGVVGRACIIAFAGVMVGGTVSVFHDTLVTGEAPALTRPVHVTIPGTAPTPTPPGAANAAPQAAPQQAPPAQEVITGPDITIAQALKLFNAGVSFVDARRRDEFEAGHVQNAYWMPAETLTSGKRPEAMDFLMPDQPVVIYCGGGECDASKNVAALLAQGGYAQCLILTDGYPAWAAAGHPTAAGRGDYEMNPPAPGSDGGSGGGH